MCGIVAILRRPSDRLPPTPAEIRAALDAQTVTLPAEAATGRVIADLVVRSGRPLSELAGVVRRLPQVLLNVEVARRDPAILDAVAADVAAAEQTLGDEGRVLPAAQRHRAARAGDGRGADGGPGPGPRRSSCAGDPQRCRREG